ncbi:MAG: F-box protein [Methylomonas sp.]|jgi:hypothetical protein|uniref:F-box protein n=1 Tax=Methylomonas sp. TaxID=418 RepID=UPI0025E8A5DE|nr:F-box protein [Methylomonas sp.]MCK9607804.1 F-box protein [Methylomonas sp.]
MDIIGDYPTALIFENLDTRELIRCRKVSKSLQRIIDSILDFRSKQLIAVAQSDKASYLDWQNVGRHCTLISITLLHICDEFMYEILRGAYAEKREDIIRWFLTGVRDRNLSSATLRRILRYAYRTKSTFLINEITYLTTRNTEYSAGAYYRLEYHLAKYGYDEQSARKICGGRDNFHENFYEGIGCRGYFLPHDSPPSTTREWKRLYRGICRSGNIEWAVQIGENYCVDIYCCESLLYYYIIGKSGCIEFVKWFLYIHLQDSNRLTHMIITAIQKHHFAIVEYVIQLLPNVIRHPILRYGFLLHDIDICKFIIPRMISAKVISTSGILELAAQCNYSAIINYLHSVCKTT